MLRAVNVFQYRLHKPLKAYYAELYVKLIMRRVFKFLKLQANQRYITILPQLVDAMNNRTLRVLGNVRPVDVSWANQQQLFHMMYPDYLRATSTRLRATGGRWVNKFTLRAVEVCSQKHIARVAMIQSAFSKFYAFTHHQWTRWHDMSCVTRTDLK